MKIYFVTANPKKMEEVASRAERFVEQVQKDEGVHLEIEICIIKKQLDELLDPDVEKIVKKKALEAYRVVHLPCVVEHGGLFLDAWQASTEKRGLLGGIGQIVWDAVGGRMCGFLREKDLRAAEAQSVVGYCDGRRVHIFPGSTRGEITDRALGEKGFRWDPIFKPTGSDQTYGQMEPEQKRETSPEEKAWNSFLDFVTKELRQS